MVIFAAAILISSIIVVLVSKGRCCDDIAAIPHNTCGLLLGMGRRIHYPTHTVVFQQGIDYRYTKIENKVEWLLS